MELTLELYELSCLTDSWCSIKETQDWGGYKQK